ncbi:cell wall hydrolase [Thioalkalicoccus limnaeus]|uniref:Cell wall hydrolase n=1 Tax=Thioalkalicoccus limnaeus TaxID=120681 RepID=A0ABV4BDC6_9GAMM
MSIVLRSVAIAAALTVLVGDITSPDADIVTGAAVAEIEVAMLESPRASVEPAPQPEPPSIPKRELECLALNIYHEARSEPKTGQIAVAAVTLNRVQSTIFPDSVCAVVKQGGPRLHRCQFSWYCDGKSDEPTERRAWDKARDLAYRSLLGAFDDPTGGATHYHANYVDPHWAAVYEPTVQLGRHHFYRSTALPSLQVALAESTSSVN